MSFSDRESLEFCYNVDRQSLLNRIMIRLHMIYALLMVLNVKHVPIHIEFPKIQYTKLNFTIFHRILQHRQKRRAMTLLALHEEWNSIRFKIYLCTHSKAASKNDSLVFYSGLEFNTYMKRYTYYCCCYSTWNHSVLNLKNVCIAEFKWRFNSKNSREHETIADGADWVIKRQHKNCKSPPFSRIKLKQ